MNINGGQSFILGNIENIDKNQIDISQIQTLVTINTANIGLLQVDLSNIESDIDNLQTQVALNTSNIATLDTNVHNIESDVDALQGEVALNIADIVLLKSDTSDLKQRTTEITYNSPSDTTTIANRLKIVKTGTGVQGMA